MLHFALARRAVHLVLEEYLNAEVSATNRLFDDLGMDSLDLAACLNDLEQVLEIRIDVKAMLEASGCTSRQELTVQHIVSYAGKVLGCECKLYRA